MSECFYQCPFPDRPHCLYATRSLLMNLASFVSYFFLSEISLISLHAGHVHWLSLPSLMPSLKPSPPFLISAFLSAIASSFRAVVWTTGLLFSYQPIIQHSLYQLQSVMDYQPQVINFNLKGLFPEIHQVPEPN